MSEAGVLIPTVAPGQWRTATKPDGTHVVTVTFAGGRDAAALQAQLIAWLRSLGAFAESAQQNVAPALLVLPQNISEQESGMVLEYQAPAKIGIEGLPADRNPREVLAVLAKLAAGLDALHAARIVHGGLGLASMWWMTDGSVVLPDVALTHALEEVLPPPSAAAGYRSPEVWRGRGFVPASDQYALAVMAFELFSGKRRLVQEDLDHIVSIEPMVMEPGARLYPGAPIALNDVLQRALSASPSARFPTCTDFVEALAGHVEAVHSMTTHHRALWGRRGGASRRVMALGAVAMASVATALVVLRGSIEPSTFPRDLQSSLPRLDASVLPTTSRSQGDGAPSAPGAMPRQTGGGAGDDGVRGELPRTAAGAGSNSSGGDLVPGQLPPSAPSSNASPDAGGMSGATSSPSGSGTVARPTITRPARASAPASSTPPRVSTLDRIGMAVRGVFQSSQSPSPRPTTATAAVASSGGTIAEVPPIASPTDDRGEARGAEAPARASAAQPASRTATVPSLRAPDLLGSDGSASASRSPRGASALSSATDPVPNNTQLSARSSAATASAVTPAAASAASATGTIRLDVPGSSRIYVDGVLVRPIGARLSVAAGAHDIDIVSPSGVRVRRRVNVPAGETIVVKR